MDCDTSQNLSGSGAISVALPQYLGTLVIVLVGALTMGVSFGFNFVRKHFHSDGDNVDVSFDAGGKVSIGLTATTIVSQWTWAATLLQSCSVATKVQQYDTLYTTLDSPINYVTIARKLASLV